VPPIIRRPLTGEELGGAVAYFPAVGLVLGLVLVGLDRLFCLALQPRVVDVLVLIAWATLRGALPLDGFLDTCDGLLGGRTPERRMEIMRDHRVGAFALVGGVLLVLLKVTALGAVGRRAAALLTAPVVGRWAMSLALAAFPYARAEGAGRLLRDHVGAGHLAVATVLALLAVLVSGGWSGLGALALGGVATLAIARYAMWRIPGLTGDIYGAICELVEVVVLLLYAGLRTTS
jgi:adenosylcobinamide-GDP ribazoletransferase